jgi:cobalt-zinc-cadmium efflux system protein
VLATLQVQPMEGVDVRTVMQQVDHELKTQFKIEHPTIGIDWDGVASCTLEEPSKAAVSHAGHSH